MTCSDLLARLGEAGVRLRRSGGELRVAGGRGSLDPALVGQIRLHRDALLARLPEGGDWWSPPVAEDGGEGDGCLAARFEARVREAPGAVAVVRGEVSITYGDLDARADRLARRLRALRAGPEARVALLADREIETVVAVLAVLKAGGAYLPLDPASPPARLAAVLRDARPVALVAGRPVEGAPPGLPLIDPAEPEAGGELAPVAALQGGGTGRLAYLIYTSGSTGMPKGVMVEHRAVLAQVAAMSGRLALVASDRVLQFAPLTFDVSVMEVFGALLTGAALVLRDDTWLGGACAFWERCAAHGVTVVDIPTRFWQLLLEERSVPVPLSVRLVVIGGEAVDVAALPAWFRRSGHRPALLNAYGPTETTVNATVQPLTEDPATWRSIGRALPGTKVHLLDGRGRPVPPGVPGELYVGGAQVARGYQGSPALTAERFLPDPFAGTRGARMYRTGDRCRWLADGSVEFLGRVDFQAKIRGFRVEPREVEDALGAHPAVRACAVVAREDRPGEPRLVAYYVAAADAEEAAAPAALRAHLAARLPEYMVPAAFLRLEALPLTRAGKLDRRALPAPPQEAPEERGCEPPEGEAEQAVARIWSEVLHRERVGRRDHFFELGGHSLLAVRVLSRVREALGADAAVADLFLRPVLADFAAGLADAPRAALPAIPPVPREGPLPLSFAQQRLWFLDRMQGAGAAYNLAAGLRLRGEVDAVALRRALDRLVARHEALRTTFEEVDGVPVQRIAPVEESGFPLREDDLSAEADPEGALRRIASAEAAAPFDLARGPLVRGRLVRLPRGEHALLVTLHHAVGDGWSLGVLLEELGAQYPAALRGEPDPLPPLAVQYADYAAWQRAWLEGERMARQAAYWNEALAGAPALLELPADHPRPPRPDHRGSAVEVALDRDLAGRLRALGERHGATPFVVLLAGWAALLARLGGVEEVVVGTPAANRGRRELEGLIGFFVNTLALRVDLSGSPTVGELVARARSGALDAQRHADLPFEQVVELVGPVRSLAHTPLVQAMLVWDGAPHEPLSLPGFVASPLRLEGPPPHATSRFDLTLVLAETEEGIGGALTYATALFERATVERWARHLRVLLRAMVESDDAPVHRLPLLEPAERRQLLEGWNDTHADVPRDATLGALFRAQARRTPDSVAVEDGVRRLTYAELRARADRIAVRLRALGAAPEARVAICLPRSLEAVVAVQGVLAAGAAYLALDPSHPTERVFGMIRDAGAVALLTLRRLAGALDCAGIPVLAVDGMDDGAPPEEPPVEAGALPDCLAYVLYTSGSTGTPKGVAVEHRSAVNHLHWARHALLADGARSIPATFPLSFDPALKQMVGPLLYGGTVWILAEEVVRDPAALLRELAGREGYAFNCVPALWRVLVAEPGAREALAGMRALLLGGEALSPELAERTFRLFPALEVWNLYGPTETTVGATADRVRPGAPVRIGRPVANARAYVLDGRGEPAPVGVPGELYVGGMGVARGYLGRPAATAERFFPDPFAGAPGARMYRTGDRARRGPDGRLESLGRTDFQVKVRGFRIETGEVEARLAEHPAVRAAVVAARADADAGLRLVAWWVGAAAAPESLREHLTARLPEYMVPAAYVRLEALPLTPNGKVDRAALPEPGAGALAARGYEAPRGATETALARIWEELLGMERVGRRDVFFELGGHSLLAVRVVSRIRQVLGREVALAELFLRPVLADLAGALDAAASPALPGIDPAPREGLVPLSFAQRRLWFLDRLEGAGRTYHMASGLGLTGALDRGALRAALDRIVVRHEALRTTFADEAGEPVQRIAPAAAVGFPLAEHDLRGSADPTAELRRIAAAEADAPFDLRSGPLARGRLVRLAEEEHALLVTMHHAVSDGWSMGIFVDELSALYAAFVRGAPDPLPPVPVQYADYVLWQRARVAGEVLTEQEGYWRAALEGAPALLSLPADRPRPSRQDYAGGMEEVVLEPPLAAALRALGQRQGTTLFMTVLAGWAALLGRLAGQEEVVVGTPSANRGRVEVERTIGLFVNTLALRVELSGSPTVAELLGRVRERALAAQRCQELPFERVVEVARPARSLGHSPLFQTMLIWQNMPRGRLELPGLSLAPLSEAETPHATSRFDLTLALTEEGDRIVGGLEYASALFDAPTVRRWLGYLRTLLAAMAADEAGRVDRLPLLTREERRRVLEGGAAPPGAPAAAASMHAAFEAWVRRTPHAVAVEDAAGSLTYAALHDRAGRLAHHLRALGVKPGARVAVCAGPGTELLAALLGVLRAGAAYAPLDPSHPAERLAFVLADAAPSALVTHRLPATLDGLGAGLPRVALEEGAWAAGPPAEGAFPAPLPGALAYVIHTSGSTGTPKGVMVEHPAVASLLGWMGRLLEVGPEDRMLALSTFAFDMSVPELFLPLAHGARVVFPPAGAQRDPAVLAGAVAAAGITLMQATPSTWRMLVGSGWQGAPGLRAVSGAEALDAGLAARLATRVQRLWNLYGPTETTVWSAGDAVEEGGGVAVGRPADGTRLSVLDAHGEPVPPGCSGELFVAGAGVARGYLGRPGLTAERYLPDPFGGEPGARAYRTGDRARWLPDGRLEYLGRADFQVKVRGFRVEPGEVEARLRAHHAVADAVVVAREDTPGDLRLAAYWTGAPAAPAALRAHLVAALPEHMIPAAYVRLDALPRTPGGKVDRGALPAPGDAAHARRGSAPPRGTTEAAVARCWRDALGVERIGRDDDFFALGGHSLLALRVVDALRRDGRELRVADIFAHPTVAALAGRLEGVAGGDEEVIAVRPGGTLPPLFMMHDGTGEVQYARVLAPHLDADVPVYALPAAPGAPGDEGLPALAARLVRLVRRVQRTGPYRLAGWSFGGLLAYEAAVQLLEAGERVTFVGMFDTVYAAGRSLGPEHALEDAGLLLALLRARGAGDVALAALEAEAEADFEAVVEGCRARGLLPHDAAAPRLREQLRRTRGHARAGHEYAPPPLHVPVRLFAARGEGDPDPLRGWPDPGIVSVPVEGTHRSMVQHPHVAGLGAALSRSLAAASA